MEKSKKIHVIKRILTLIFIAESIVWLALPIMAFTDTSSDGNFYPDFDEIIESPIDEEKIEIINDDIFVENHYLYRACYDGTNVIMAEPKVAQVGLGIYEYIVLSDDTVVITAYVGAETNVKIPSELDGHQVSTIGECAFYGKKLIKSIVIPEGVTLIEMSAFQHCLKLETVVLPQSLTNIDDLAFAENSALKNVVLPDNIKEIGEFAFGLCTSMTEMYIPASVEYIGLSPFDGSSAMERIEVDENNEYFLSEDGVLFNKDKTELICYPAAKTGDTYIIPETVHTIGVLAFSGNTKIRHIEISANVVNIENLAIYRCRNLTIYTYEGSEAERYADENRINLVLLVEEIKGDVDANGVLDYNDYSMVNAYILCNSDVANMIAENENYKGRADINGDGVVDAFDAIGIELRIAGLVTD